MSQYVGARYTPKFMGTYNVTQAYENLCVVDNGMGTSYISNKPVPAGTPLTNTEYWAIYGASNGAIINLQNQIDDNRADIEVLKSKSGFTDRSNVILIGDSWTVGHNDGGIYKGFGTYLVDRLPHEEWYQSAEGSCGFAAIGSGGHTFQGLLEEIVVTDPDTITDIIVEGGVNDRNQSYSDITAAIRNFVDYVRATYINAKVHILIVNKVYNTSNASFSYIKAYMDCSGYKKHCIVYDCHKSVSFDNWLDNLHATIAGYEQCAEYCANALMGGVPSLGWTVKTVAAECTNLGWTGNLTISESPDGTLYVEFPEMNITGLSITGTIADLDFVFTGSDLVPQLLTKERIAAVAYIKLASETNKLAMPVSVWVQTPSTIRIELFKSSALNEFYFVGGYALGNSY